MTERTRTDEARTGWVDAPAAAELVPRQRGVEVAPRPRLVVDVRPLPARVTAPFAPLIRWRLPVAVYGSVLGVVGVGGYVLTATGLLDGAVRALGGLTLLFVLGWLGYAGASVHTHHCPGCRFH